MSKAKPGAAAPSSTNRLTPVIRLLVGRGRRLTLVAVVMTLAALVGHQLWRHVGEHVLARDQYQLTSDRIVVTPAPTWIRADIRSEVMQSLMLDGSVTILDDTLASRVAETFNLHPWVARVVRVTKHVPARVEVELIYRRPVLMVEVPGGLYPVDDQGVLLPTADFMPDEARQYPRLAGIQTVTEGPVGTRWQDDRVAGAAALAAVLIDAWKDLDLHRILPVASTSDTATTEFVLLTSGGRRITWGARPGAEPPGEPPAAEKLQRLRQLVGKDAGDSQIDLRLQDTRAARLPAARASVAK